jgi:hypothetical protein
MGTGKKEQGRPAESDHRICVSNSRARLENCRCETKNYQTNPFVIFVELCQSTACEARPLFPSKNEPILYPTFTLQAPRASRVPTSESHVRPSPSALGPWTLAFGPWPLDDFVPRSPFRVPRSMSGLWTLDFGPWTLPHLLRVPRSEFRVRCMDSSDLNSHPNSPITC